MSQLITTLVIDRPLVIKQLQKHLAKGHVFLTAPGGYGKSVVLQALTRQQPNSYILSLSTADSDPSILQSRLEPLLAKSHHVLLDDVHLLEGASESLDYLESKLEEAEVHYLLSGRHLPLNTDFYVIQGKAAMLDKTLLALSFQESQRLFKQAPEQLLSWHQKLEGWPLALSLLARLNPQQSGLPAASSHIFDYLARAVFAKLPKQLFTFMCITAVPLQFNAELAQHLSPEAEASRLLTAIQARNLYVQEMAAGWFKYHDLVREFLLQEKSQGKAALAERAVHWFLANDDLDSAVENAIDADLEGLKEKLISETMLSHFHDSRSYLTYKRWVLSLAPEVLRQHTQLYVRLGNVLSLLEGRLAEARSWMDQAEMLARQDDDVATWLLARTNQALFCYKESRLSEAHAIITAVLQHPDCQAYPRMFALRIASLIKAELGLNSDLSQLFKEVISLAQSQGADNEPHMNRGNWVSLYLLPTGRFAKAEQEMAKVLEHFQHSPGWLNQYLLFWCEYFVLTGDWPGLEEILERAKHSVEEVEDPDLYFLLWQTHYTCILAIVNDDAPRFESLIARYDRLASESPVNQLAKDVLRLWWLRHQGRYEEGCQLSEASLAQAIESPYQRALIALEGDIHRFLAGHFHGLHPETITLIKMRARPHLPRLRALLAVHCYQQGQPSWQRHYDLTVRSLTLYGFQDILIRRDPLLGLHFWQLGLLENRHRDLAKQALIAISMSQELLPLLAHKDADITQHVAEILASIGDERSLPALSTALIQPLSKGQHMSCQQAIAVIEQSPPPALQVSLMGEFGLQRGKTTIGHEAWSRPVVRQLFAYFAIHLDKALSKDKILDDLWPDTARDKAWKTYRTVYSLVRKVIEPFMPAKAPNRYMRVKGNSYALASSFVATDVHQFESTVRLALKDPERISLTELEMAAEAYAPILPEIAYEEWLLEPRQRAQDLFLEAGLQLANRLLSQGQYRPCKRWTDKILLTAPWLEEAYQLAMRAHARMGQRSLALHVYEEAVVQLKKELNIEPSELSRWLAEKLRQGESI